MEIQTYEIEETVGGTTPEVEAEALALIESLGLDGQKALVRPGATAGAKERFQYPVMTAHEMAVYRAVFPERTKIEQYSSGIIPVRVLQVASHAKGFCNWVEVWHKDWKAPDPLLVGVVGQNDYSVKQRFLLARWGDALRDFSEMVTEARSIIRTETKAKCEEKFRDAKRSLEDYETIAEKTLRGESVFF